MDSSQDSLLGLIPPPEFSAPATPEPEHAVLDETAAASAFMAQPERSEGTASKSTPPPSSQLPASPRRKTRTPTPVDAISHISTPPPTVEGPAANQSARASSGNNLSDIISAKDVEDASAEELRVMVVAMQAAAREAKMSAAHHKLQYQMLSQESSAALERMAIEAHMAQCEDQIIHNAEQAKATAPPARSSPVQEGMITVQKDAYGQMQRELHLLAEENSTLKAEYEEQEKVMLRQEHDIAKLTDKISIMRDLMRERRDAREQAYTHGGHVRSESTPRSLYSTPHRGNVGGRDPSQPFAALLQASEMASQDAARSHGSRGMLNKRGHHRGSHSISHIPSTPQSARRAPASYQTPQGRQQAMRVPSTAPIARMGSVRSPGIYSQPVLPVSSKAVEAQSEDTVSASEQDDNDVDSEADTEIIEQDETDRIDESHASRAASAMLRTSQEELKAQRNSFKSTGMPPPPSGDKYRQTKLFGALRKSNVDREAERPTKRARTTEATAVGLGINGVRH